MPRRRSISRPPVAAVLLLTLVAGTPLFRGGVDLPAIAAAAVVAGAALFFAARPLRTRSAGAPGTGAGSEVLSQGPSYSGLELPILAVGLALVSVWIAFQLVPLPAWLVGAIDPAAAELFRRNLGPIGAYPAARPLSLDPGATALDMGKDVAWAAVVAASTLVAAERRRRDALLQGVALSGTAVVAVVLGMALFAGAPWLEPRLPFVNPNHLAGFLQLVAWVAVGFAARERGAARVGWIVAFAFAGLGIFLSLSRAGIAAFLVGAGLFVALYLRAGGRERVRRGGPLDSAGSLAPPAYGPTGRRRGAASAALAWARRLAARSSAVIPVAISLALALAAYLALDRIVGELRTVSDASTTEVKLDLWPIAARMIRAFPLTGIGRGAFATSFPAYKWEPLQATFTHVENELLQVPLDLGLVFGGALVALFVWAWASAARRPEISRPVIGALAGSAALVAQNAFDFSLEIPGVAVAFAVVMGVLARDMRKVRVPRWTLRVGALGAVALSLGALAVHRSHDPDRDAGRIAAARTADEALVIAREVLPWHPADWVPAAVVGGLLASEFRCAEAEPWLDRAMLRNPTAPQPHLGAARCDALRGRPVLAKREYRLAFMLGDWGVLAEAHAMFPWKGAIFDVAPDTPDGLFAAGQALGDDPPEAREAYRRGWESYQDARSLSALASLTLQAKDDGAADEALRLARELQRVEPTDPAGYVVAARALDAASEAAAAVQELELGAARLPGNEWVLTELGVRHLAQRRFSQARAVFERIAARDEGAVARRKLLVVRALEGQGRYAEALGEARGARDADPGSAAPLEAMARLAAALGRYDDALASLEEAARKPGPPGRYDAWVGQLREARTRQVVKALGP